MSSIEPLTPWQRDKLVEVILLGCDRATACDYVGCTPQQLAAQIDRDASLERELARAAAQAEVRHMSNVHAASRTEANWRTSVWWLDRRDQSRAAEAAAGPTERSLRELIQAMAQILAAELADVQLQRRLIERLLAAAAGDAPPDEATEPHAESHDTLNHGTPQP